MAGRMIKIVTRLFKSGVSGRSRAAVIFLVLSAALYGWSRDFLPAVLISACASLYINDLVNTRRRIYRRRLHRQLVEFLEHMIIMLRAGKTVRHIFSGSWTRFRKPLGGYLREVAEGLEVDPDLDRALDVFEKKSGSREIGLLAAGIRINKDTGGDLIILLESVSVTLRESLRARSRMENLTLQSRMSADIICLFPIAAFISIYLFNSRAILDLFSTTAGKIILAAGGLMEIAGIVLIKKITRG